MWKKKSSRNENANEKNSSQFNLTSHLTHCQHPTFLFFHKNSFTLSKFDTHQKRNEEIILLTEDYFFPRIKKLLRFEILCKASLDFFRWKKREWKYVESFSFSDTRYSLVAHKTLIRVKVFLFLFFHFSTAYVDFMLRFGKFPSLDFRYFTLVKQFNLEIFPVTASSTRKPTSCQIKALMNFLSSLPIIPSV